MGKHLPPMYYTASLVFDHRNRTRSGQTGPIEVRIYQDNKTSYISTGIRARKSEFRAGTIINRPDSPELNQRLTIILRKIESLLNEDLTIADIRQRLRTSTQQQTFIAWAQSQVPLLTVSPATRLHYITLIQQLVSSQIIVSFSDLTTEKITLFDSHLHTIRSKTGQPITTATVHNYHKCLKALINRAVVFDLIPLNPYTKLQGRFSRGDTHTVRYLTTAQVQAISALQITDYQTIKARDLFLFQCYTGLSYSDAVQFDISNYRLQDGLYRCVDQRIKTGQPFVAALLPPVVQILQRHNMQVPRLTNQRYNIILKAIGIMAAIPVPLHSHMARHTFATTMLQMGVSIEHVSRMLGHTDITMTQRYAKVLAADVNASFTRIADLLDNSNQK